MDYRRKTNRKNMWEVWHCQRRIGTAALQGHPYCDVNIEGSTASVSPFPVNSVYSSLWLTSRLHRVLASAGREQAPKITDACLYVVSNDLDLNFLLFRVYCTFFDPRTGVTVIDTANRCSFVYFCSPTCMPKLSNTFYKVTWLIWCNSPGILF